MYIFYFSIKKKFGIFSSVLFLMFSKAQRQNGLITLHYVCVHVHYNLINTFALQLCTVYLCCKHILKALIQKKRLVYHHDTAIKFIELVLMTGKQQERNLYSETKQVHTAPYTADSAHLISNQSKSKLAS